MSITNNQFFVEGLSLLSYCKKYDINYTMVYSRIKHKKMSVDDAIKDVLKVKKKDLPQVDDTALKQYCADHNLDFAEVKRKINVEHMSMEEALNKPKKPRSTAKYFVSYKGEIMSFMEAIKQFYKDNDLSLTTVTACKATEDYPVQQVFDDYCHKILKKFHRI